MLFVLKIPKSASRLLVLGHITFAFGKSIIALYIAYLLIIKAVKRMHENVTPAFAKIA